MLAPFGSSRLERERESEQREMERKRETELIPTHLKAVITSLSA